jgi:DNA polymerase-1
MGKPRLFLIDATAFCYRAFYALSGLSTSFGQPTNAIYGFLNMLNKILKENKPEFMAVCFDVSRDTFRQKKFADYKINRPPMAEGLVSQMPYIKKIILAYGIPLFEKEGFEADDVIATLAEKAKRHKMVTAIISSDKDILQLVDKDVEVLSPHKDQTITYDSGKIIERFGVEPRQITDIIALMGDDVDNIPGVSGIGEKTAVNLIKEFGSLDNLLKNIDKVKQPRTKEAIAGNIDKIKFNKEMVVLEKNVDIDFDSEKVKIGKPDFEELFKLFKFLEFKAFLKDLPVQDDQKLKHVEALEDRKIKDFIIEEEGLFLYANGSGDLIFSQKGKFFKPDSIGQNIKAVLSNTKIKKIGHDLKRNKTQLAGKDIVLEGLSFDTMIAAYLLNPSKSDYSLSNLAWDYLNKAVMNKTLDSQRALALIVELEPELEKQLKTKSLLNLFYEIEMPLIEVLAAMEKEGIRLDLGLLKELSSHLEKRLASLIEEIYRLSDCQFNINSPKQLRQILFEKLKLRIVKKTKTGASTDEGVLKSLASEHKLPSLLLEYRQLMKLKTTYVDALPELVNQKTQRIHTSFNQTGTETGRLSSSNPNLQNIPVKTELGRMIRKAVIAKGDDYQLLSSDYSQIELRILAHLSKDETLISAFKKDKDIHLRTASLIYEVEEKDVTEPMRDIAKKVNFGIIYGQSAYGLSKELGISQMEAQNFIDAYFLKYPKVKDYMDKQISHAQKEGFVTTILGRRRYLPEINNKNQNIRQLAQRQAVNTPIQGSASDLIKMAMIKLFSQIKKKNLKSKIILQIHDELLFDVYDKEKNEFVHLVEEIMENVLKLEVPIRVDVKIGRNWAETISV